MQDATPSPIDDALRAGRQLGSTVAGVVAVGLAGSQARGTARPNSDVDLVVLTDSPPALLLLDGWHAVFGEGTTLIRSGDFGAIQERRLLTPDGTVVEVGIGSVGWASTTPVDPGTHRVVSDGFVALYDPRNVLTNLIAAVAASP